MKSVNKKIVLLFVVMAFGPGVWATSEDFKTGQDEDHCTSASVEKYLKVKDFDQQGAQNLVDYLMGCFELKRRGPLGGIFGENRTAFYKNVLEGVIEELKKLLEKHVDLNITVPEGIKLTFGSLVELLDSFSKSFDKKELENDYFVDGNPTQSITRSFIVYVQAAQKQAAQKNVVKKNKEEVKSVALPKPDVSLESLKNKLGTTEQNVKALKQKLEALKPKLTSK